MAPRDYFPQYATPLPSAGVSSGGQFDYRTPAGAAGDIAAPGDTPVGLTPDDMARANAAARAAAEESRRALAAEASRREQERRMATDPTASAGARAQGASGRGQAALAELGRTKVVKTANPKYEPVRRYDERMLGTESQPGLLSQTMDAQRGVDAAAIAREQLVAEAMGRAADVQRVAMGRLEENQQAQAQRMSEQLARVGRATELASVTAEKFAAMPAPDRARYWRNAPAWQKFFAGLAAAANGWIWAPNPIGHITGAIEADIETQKAAIAQASQAVGDARAQVGLQKSLYADILGHVGHEREADLIYTKAMLETAHADLVAQLQRHNITVLNAGQKAAMVGLQTKIADVTKALEIEAATNVPYRVSQRPLYNKDQRALLVHEGKAAIDEGVAARRDITTQVAEREKRKSDLQLEYDKLAATAAAKGQKSDTDKRLESQQRMWVVQQTRERVKELNALEKWRKSYPNGIPGYIWGIGWTRPNPGEINPFWTKDAEQAYNELHRAVTMRLRADSGAVISDMEERKDAPALQNLYAQIDAEATRIIGAHNSEDALYAWVDGRIQEARDDIDYVQRGVAEPVNQDVTQARIAPRKPLQFGGTAGADSERWED